MKIKTFPPAFLHELSKESHGNKKGELRLLAILDWLYRWRYASQQILVNLLSNSGTEGEAAAIRAALRRWDGRYIRSFTLATDVSRVGYVLKADGLFKLSMAQPQRKFTKPFTETSALTTSAAKRHDLTAQAAAIFMMKSQGYTKYASEWEYRDGSRGKVFDCVIESPESRLGIEVEMTPKTRTALHDALYAAAEAIDAGEVNTVAYLVPTPALERMIKKAINDTGVTGVTVKVSQAVAKMAGVRS
ncbi:hypothetical protein P8S54_11020 (plasmid) [Thiomicrospira sp. R3]|uniref:hypothetical protein n=2 Tax=Thiomicrospira sp. R3 TaxID=3035472 RepID=UPI00259B457E|nr:hypothetical protein [Thiomicrospira sp. R3]WFE69819.1 hypothetical protein P8S54_11020 [Thiomicrospira sp. R3]